MQDAAGNGDVDPFNGVVECSGVEPRKSECPARELRILPDGIERRRVGDGGIGIQGGINPQANRFLNEARTLKRTEVRAPEAGSRGGPGASAPCRRIIQSTAWHG